MYSTITFRKLTMLLALTVFSISTSAISIAKAPAQKKPLVYSVTKRVLSLDSMAAIGVASIGNVNGTNVRGTYLTNVSPAGVAHDIGLVSGDLLLMINNRVTESPEITESLIAEFSSVKSTVRFARKEGNALVVHEAPASWLVQRTEGTMVSSPGNDDVSSYGAVTHAPQQKVTADELEDFMMQMVNNARTLNGNLPKLKRSKTLSDMARAYAEDMAKRNFFSHKNPEGLSTVQRATTVGVTGHIAENIGMNRGGLEPREHVKRCQENMMNEPPNVPGNHRGNILDPETKSVGIGVAFPAKGGVIAVQDFSHDEVP